MVIYYNPEFKEVSEEKRDGYVKMYSEEYVQSLDYKSKEYERLAEEFAFIAAHGECINTFQSKIIVSVIVFSGVLWLMSFLCLDRYTYIAFIAFILYIIVAAVQCFCGQRYYQNIIYHHGD